MLTGSELGAAIDAARVKKGMTKKALADHFGVRPPSIQDWIKRGTIDKQHLPGLWALFADVVGPEHWGLNDNNAGITGKTSTAQAGQTLASTTSYPLFSGVAHRLTLHEFKVPPLITWEALMTENVTPDEYRTHASNDALAPRLRAGGVLTLDRRLEPRAGDGVLLRDRTGALHLRIYRPVVGRWEAHATHPDYPAMDSERDGLQVLAVLTSVDQRWG